MTTTRATASRRSVGSIGLTLAILTAATFATSGVFASSLIAAGWSAGAAVLARILLAALLLTIPALIQLRGRWKMLRRGIGRAAAFGLIAVAGAQLCYFNAIERVPVGVALLLEYLGIVLVVGWLWLSRGQRPRRLKGCGLTAQGGIMGHPFPGASPGVWALIGLAGARSNCVTSPSRSLAHGCHRLQPRERAHSQAFDLDGESGPQRVPRHARVLR